MDGQRHTEPELDAVRRANVDSERQRFAVERPGPREPEEAIAPTRVGAVQGQIDLALREGDRPTDERLDPGGACGGAAEKQGEHCTQRGHRPPEVRWLADHAGSLEVGDVPADAPAIV